MPAMNMQKCQKNTFRDAQWHWSSGKAKYYIPITRTSCNLKQEKWGWQRTDNVRTLTRY